MHGKPRGNLHDSDEDERTLFLQPSRIKGKETITDTTLTSSNGGQPKDELLQCSPRSNLPDISTKLVTFDDAPPVVPSAESNNQRETIAKDSSWDTKALTSSKTDYLL